jgi:hypothetical protein
MFDRLACRDSKGDCRGVHILRTQGIEEDGDIGV